MYGPPGPSENGAQTAAASPSPSPAPQYGPQLPQQARVVVVLGPGLARAFAGAGVLKALEEQKIQVGAVMGSEMGAVVAALYVFSKSRNDFEWKLTKLRPELFESSGTFSLSGFLGKRGRPVSDLEKTLAQMLGDQKIEDAKIPLFITAFSETTARPVVLKSGSAAQASIGAIATSERGEAVSFENQGIRACSFECSFRLQEAKALGLGPVIVVDTVTEKPAHLGDKESAYYGRVVRDAREIEEQLAPADLVIRPEIRGVGYFDYSMKSTAAFAGAKALRNQLPKIQELIQKAAEPKP